jgi:hypothetical protein
MEVSLRCISEARYCRAWLENLASGRKAFGENILTLLGNDLRLSISCIAQCTDRFALAQHHSTSASSPKYSFVVFGGISYPLPVKSRNVFKVTPRNIRGKLLINASYSVRYSGCQYGPTHLPQDGYLWSLALEIFTDIYGQNSNLMKSGEKNTSDWDFTWRSTYIHVNISLLRRYVQETWHSQRSRNQIWRFNCEGTWLWFLRRRRASILHYTYIACNQSHSPTNAYSRIKILSVF